MQVRDRGLDLLRQPLPGELRGEANGVLDGLGARPAVADDDAALHAEHRRSPVLGVVEPRLEPPEGGPRQQEPDGRFERALDLVAQQLLDHLRQGLGDFQDDVAGEPVGHDDVHLAVENVPSFDVADEVQAGLLEDPERLLRAFASLGVLLADGHQADGRRGLFEHELPVDRAHDREFLEVLRLGLGVRADVQEQAVSGQVREDRREGRPVHPSDDHLGGDHRGAGVAGRDEPLRTAVPNAVGGDPDRGIPLLPDRRGRRVGHAHDVGGVDHLDLGALVAGVREEPRQLVGAPDEERCDAEFPESGHRPVHVDPRSMVAAHRIHRDAHVRP